MHWIYFRLKKKTKKKTAYSAATGLLKVKMVKDLPTGAAATLHHAPFYDIIEPKVEKII